MRLAKYIPGIDLMAYFDETTGGYVTFYDPSDIETRLFSLGADPTHTEARFLTFGDVAYDPSRNRLYYSMYVTSGGGMGRVYRSDVLSSLPSGIVTSSEYVSARELWAIEYVDDIDMLAVACGGGTGNAKVGFIDLDSFNDLHTTIKVEFPGPAIGVRGLTYRPDNGRLYASVVESAGGSLFQFMLAAINVHTLSVDSYVRMGPPTTGPIFPSALTSDFDGNRSFARVGKYMSFLT